MIINNVDIQLIKSYFPATGAYQLSINYINICILIYTETPNLPLL